MRGRDSVSGPRSCAEGVPKRRRIHCEKFFYTAIISCTLLTKWNPARNRRDDSAIQNRPRATRIWLVYMNTADIEPLVSRGGQRPGARRAQDEGVRSFGNGCDFRPVERDRAQTMAARTSRPATLYAIKKRPLQFLAVMIGWRSQNGLRLAIARGRQTRSRTRAQPC